MPMSFLMVARGIIYIIRVPSYHDKELE